VGSIDQPHGWKVPHYEPHRIVLDSPEVWLSDTVISRLNQAAVESSVFIDFTYSEGLFDDFLKTRKEQQNGTGSTGSTAIKSVRAHGCTPNSKVPTREHVATILKDAISDNRCAVRCYRQMLYFVVYALHCLT